MNDPSARKEEDIMKASDGAAAAAHAPVAGKARATSLVLSTAATYLLPLLLFLSVYALARGHNLPGGGFIGGIIAASAFSLFAITHDAEAAHRALRLHPRLYIVIGLFLAGGAGLAPMVAGKPFLTALWADAPFLFIQEPNTPLIFDTGVYLVVIGGVMTIFISLMED